MRKALLGLLFLALLAVNVFATTGGAYYTGVTEPLAGSQVDAGSIKAEGSNMSILSLFAFGDASIEKIAAQADIRKINHIDQNNFSIWWLFAQETFTVYGDK